MITMQLALQIRDRLERTPRPTDNAWEWEQYLLHLAVRRDRMPPTRWYGRSRHVRKAIRLWTKRRMDRPPFMALRVRTYANGTMHVHDTAGLCVDLVLAPSGAR